MKSRGAILLIALLVTSMMLALGAALVKITSIDSRIVSMEYERKQAFYLAEAGIEKAKTVLAKDPYWFTDQPDGRHDQAVWLVEVARGNIESMGSGYFKIIKESSRNTLYSVGYIERNGKKSAISIIRVEYKAIPFRQTGWKLI